MKRFGFVGCRWSIPGLAVFAMAVVSSGGVADDVVARITFDRYTPILERMPFGRPPPQPPTPPSVEAEMPSPVIEAFVSRHRLCALTRTDTGIGVGFIDSAQNPPKPYFMMVGDTMDGYEVVSADFQRETVTLRKHNETFSLTLDGQVTAAESAVLQAVQAADESDPALRRRGPGRVRPSAGDASIQDRQSYVELVRQRQEARARMQEEETERQRQQVERLTGEALQRHLREVNMDLIRAAGSGQMVPPPLPITLTPEEDAQLVAEGVLPPPDDEDAAVP